MKKTKQLLIAIGLVLIHSFAMAQPGPPPPPPTEGGSTVEQTDEGGGASLEGGVVGLVLLAAAYGSFRLYRTRKSKLLSNNR